MKHLLKLFFIIIVLLSFKSYSSPVSADIAFAKLTDKQDLVMRHIEIDSSFRGMKMLLFGARHDAGDVVVVVRGPKLSYGVRGKKRVAGVWINGKQYKYHDVNAFFALATSRPLDKMGNDYLLSSLGILNENIAWFYPNHEQIDERRHKYLNALIERKQNQGLYNAKPEKIDFVGDTLFRTVVNFPDNIPKGEYTVEIYLFRDSKLVGLQSIPMLVEKTGFDAFIYDMAHNWPVIYGLFSVIGALISGWLAGILFRKI